MTPALVELCTTNEPIITIVFLGYLENVSKMSLFTIIKYCFHAIAEDILQNVEQFFEIPRPELSSPFVSLMPLRDALRALFAPFGTVALSPSADCSGTDVITDILHMSNDISA